MPVRETFWNIPHWAEILQYILGFLTLVIFLSGMARHVQHWRRGAPTPGNGQALKRWGRVLRHAVLQERTARDIYPGIMHLMIFWGMAVLLLGTILATVDWDVTHLFFGFQFLKGGIYVAYELALDLLGLLVVAGVAMAAWRRWGSRPDRLANVPGSNWEDDYILFLLALIAISGYLVEGLRIAVAEPAWAPWSPVGNAIANGFTRLGDPAGRSLHLTLWILHMLAAFLFVGSIPFTKLFHLISAPINIYFSALEPPGKLSPPPNPDSAGMRTGNGFTWKQLLDFDACTRCGRCQDVCPAFSAGLPLSPRDVMVRLHRASWSNAGTEPLTAAVPPTSIWSCTTCLACVDTCPVFTDPVSSIVAMRRDLILEGAVDDELSSALGNLARYGNSFGRSERMRARWTRALDTPPKHAGRERVEYLLFLGDYASFHTGLTAVTVITAKLFQRLDLDFGILYDKERNAGNDVRRVGEEGLFDMLVEKNVETLSRARFQAIVTTDPHTYNVLKHEYPQIGSAERRVLHYSELLAAELESGRITFNLRLKDRVTYHDPCYLGRYNGLYEAPRRVIRATGCELVEMPRNRQNALCCGAGGGRIWMEEHPETQQRPAESRILEAAALPGVTRLIVTCPKDLVMFRDALKTTGLEGRLEVMDLAELVFEALG